MRRFVLRLTGGLLACALACVVYLRHRQIQVELEKPFGRFTQQQILERTLPLCQTILGPTHSLLLSTEQYQAGTANGTPRLWWRLQCTDSAGRMLAVFAWDARTGELASVTSHVKVAASPGKRTEEPARAQAAWLSYRWLHRLGIAGEESRWRLTQEPERSARHSAVWYTCWRSADHQTVVQVDVGSGALVSAQNVRLSSTASAP
jgi:hypothetical protein